MPSYGSGPTTPQVSLPQGSIEIGGMATTAYSGGTQYAINGLMDALNSTPKVTVTDDTIIEVGDEQITGKELGQVIKIMKQQYPEVFV